MPVGLRRTAGHTGWIKRFQTGSTAMAWTPTNEGGQLPWCERESGRRGILDSEGAATVASTEGGKLDVK